jgi:low temperature requirement protein LtrA
MAATEPSGSEQRVTALELFFDLVFVFAITQVSGFVAADPTWTRMLEALGVLAVLWWAWEAFAWLGNTAGSDDGAVRAVLLVAMGPLFVVSLAVPHAFGQDALVFGIAYFAVRALHLLGYVVLSRGDPVLRGVVGRLASTALPAIGLLVLAGALSGTGRTVCWIAALAIDFGGLALRGVAGWHVGASHLAERHGLIVIIALGESIVSLGVGAGHLALDAHVIVAALLGIAVAAALWWAYFDVVGLAAERRLSSAADDEQARIARDAYTYLHLPMVAGIVLFAVGLKETLETSGDELGIVVATALCGGVALYLVALSALKRRNYGSYNRPRLAAAAVLLALIPLAHGVVAPLGALALVALVCCLLIAYEVRTYAEARERIRHGLSR